MNKLNLTQKGNFRFDIPDNDLTELFQMNIQNITFPGVSTTNATVVRSPKLTASKIAGSGTEYDDIEIVFLLDENLTAYAELYRWMLTIQNPVGPTTQSPNNIPRTALLHVLDNLRKDIVATFKFHELYPTRLGEIEWNYTETGDLESITCNVTFSYTFFDMILNNSEIISPRPYG